MVTSAGEKNSDDTPSHVRMIGEDRTMFRENSKHFKFVGKSSLDKRRPEDDGPALYLVCRPLHDVPASQAKRCLEVPEHPCVGETDLQGKQRGALQEDLQEPMGVVLL